MTAARLLYGDKGYDSNAIRRQVEENGTMPNIPPRQAAAEELLFARALPRPKRHRAHMLPYQGLPTRRHAIRPKRRQLPRCRLHRGHHPLLVVSADPNPTEKRQPWPTLDGKSYEMLPFAPASPKLRSSADSLPIEPEPNPGSYSIEQAHH